jgi:hypothetical protein
MKQQLMLVAMLSVGTALTTMGRLKPVAASFTPPTTYDYSYTWNATDTEQYLNVNGVDSIPLYVRTPNSTYFNYVNTTVVIDGLEVRHQFDRSNTTWQASGMFYKPDQSKIGSDNTVGTITNKVNLKFTNNTNHDYLIYLDVASNLGNDHWTSGYDSYTTFQFFYAAGALLRFPLYSNSSFEFFKSSWSVATYFDAWYIQDLGISEVYEQGLDAETDGILTDYLGTDAQQIGWVLIGIAAILFAFKGGK